MAPEITARITDDIFVWHIALPLCMVVWGHMGSWADHKWPKSVRGQFQKGWLVGAGMGAIPVLQVVNYVYCLSALVHNMMWHSCQSTLVCSTTVMAPFVCCNCRKGGCVCMTVVFLSVVGRSSW